MPTPAPGPSATLEQIKERAKAARFAPALTRDWARGKSADDVPVLVAALEAVLKLADDWEAKAKTIGSQIRLEDCDGATAGFKMIGYQQHRDHASALREAITRALKGDTDA